MIHQAYKNLVLKHEHQGDSLPDAPDRPPTRFVTIIVIISFLFVFAVWFFGGTLLNVASDYLRDKSPGGMDNEKRINYINQQEDYLKTQKALPDGKHKISIDRAIEKLVEHNGKIN